MEQDARMEFSKIATAFKEFREAVFQRERDVKAALHEKIRDAQASLKADRKVLRDIISELTALGDASENLRKGFNRNDDAKGIVGSAPRVKFLKEEY